jgi:hypothetical protein
MGLNRRGTASEKFYWRPVAPTEQGPLTAVVSGFFALTGQALTASCSSSAGPPVCPAILSGTDPNLHGLLIVGANFGANCEAVESSVPVALAASGVAVRDSAGRESIAPATSNNFGSVWTFMVRSIVE